MLTVLVAELCPTLSDPRDCSPPGSSVHGISQARILEWVAIPFSGDLPDPGVEPGSPHCQQILYRLSHHGIDELIYKAEIETQIESKLMDTKGAVEVG